MYKIMKQDNNRYTAEDGKLIVRKPDGYIMGDTIDLGTEDSIDNYIEKDFTKEEIDAFYESVGMTKRGLEPSNKRRHSSQISAMADVA